MLQQRPQAAGKPGRAFIEERFNMFQRGEWEALLDFPAVPKSPNGIFVENEKERGRKARSSVQLGEVSRARHKLTDASLAPGTETTFYNLHAKRQQTQKSQLPQSVANFVRQDALYIDREILAQCLRIAPKGSSPGPGALTYEHLRALLDDPVGFELFADAAEIFARAELSGEISAAYILAHLAALTKSGGGVRGIAAGATLRRLVARTLARQFA